MFLSNLEIEFLGDSNTFSMHTREAESPNHPKRKNVEAKETTGREWVTKEKERVRIRTIWYRRVWSAREKRGESFDSAGGGEGRLHARGARVDVS